MLQEKSATIATNPVTGHVTVDIRRQARTRVRRGIVTTVGSQAIGGRTVTRRRKIKLRRKTKYLKMLRKSIIKVT